MSETSPTRPNSTFRLLRERGTVRIVLGAALILAAYYAIGAIKVYRMQQVKWPPLTPDLEGVTVLGLPDKDKPGRPRKYVAIEANHAWQIRRPDDAGVEADEEDETEERSEYRPAAAVASRAAAGSIVPLEELLKTCPVVLRGEHFRDASMSEDYEPFRDKHYYRVHVKLTDEGRSRYWQYSRDHDDESLVFLVKKEIVTCPKMSHMDTASLTIEPIWIKEDAEKLVRALNGKL